ncbi:MAG: cellulose-binding protein, partial [Bacillota bacterium]|nr:cellulose-binding protein [Bacillota bacterium]
MKQPTTQPGLVCDCRVRINKWILCCLLILLTVCFMAAFSAVKVNAAGETPGTLYPFSPTEQQMKLSQQSAVIPGGKGFLLPYTVVAKDGDGKPLAGIPVTFEISKNDMITAVMRGSSSRIITVTTNANGFASAANTYASYIGEGYQVFSQYPGIKQTLQLTATVSGWNKITFNIEIGTAGVSMTDTTAPDIGLSVKDDKGADYVAGTWTNRPVTAHFTAVDTLSAVKSCTSDLVFDNEGLNQTAKGTASDVLNNVHNVTFGPINIDKNPPASSVVIPQPVFDNWNNSKVEIKINAIDSVSGVDSVYYKLGNGTPVKTSGSSATAVVDVEGVTEVNYWSVDKAGNAETQKSVTVKLDKSGPSVTANLSTHENQNGWNNSDVSVNLSAVDSNSGVKEIHYKIGASAVEQTVKGATASFNVSNEGITAISYWAVDNVGFSSEVQTKEVKIDKTKPVIIAPQNITVEANAVLTHVQLGTATVSDIINITPTNDAPADLCFPIGVTTIIWTAEDMVGNKSYSIQTVTVKDTTNPIITVPGEMVVEATGIGTPVNPGEAKATDIFNVTITNNAPAYFPLGKTVVTWTAKDANGNAVTADQNVTVLDRTKPELVVPSNITLEATAKITPVDIGKATATDIFSYTITNNAPE